MARGGSKSKWEKLDMENRLNEVAQVSARTRFDKDIYEYLGISYNVFYQWLNERPEFKNAVKIGRVVSMEDIMNAQKRKSEGFWEFRPRKKVKRKKQRNEETGRMVLVEETVDEDVDGIFIQPSTEAARFVRENEGTREFEKSKVYQYLERVVKNMTDEEMRAFLEEVEEEE